MYEHAASCRRQRPRVRPRPRCSQRWFPSPDSRPRFKYTVDFYNTSLLDVILKTKPNCFRLYAILFLIVFGSGGVQAAIAGQTPKMPPDTIYRASDVGNEVCIKERHAHERVGEYSRFVHTIFHEDCDCSDDFSTVNETKNSSHPEISLALHSYFASRYIEPMQIHSILFPVSCIEVGRVAGDETGANVGCHFSLKKTGTFCYGDENSFSNIFYIPEQFLSIRDKLAQSDRPSLKLSNFTPREDSIRMFAALSTSGRRVNSEFERSSDGPCSVQLRRGQEAMQVFSMLCRHPHSHLPADAVAPAPARFCAHPHIPLDATACDFGTITTQAKHDLAIANARRRRRPVPPAADPAAMAPPDGPDLSTALCPPPPLLCEDAAAAAAAAAFSEAVRRREGGVRVGGRGVCVCVVEIDNGLSIILVVDYPRRLSTINYRFIDN